MRSQNLIYPLGALALFGGVSCSEDPAETRPNIIVILVDDMGYGDVSALNPESKINTPNLDRLASEGVVFTDAHSSSSVSTPTRYGLLTGRYNWRSELKSYVLWGYSPALIAPDRTTIATALSKGGYHTAAIGKWHLGWGWNNVEKGKDSIDYSQPITNGPTTRGFDYYYGLSASLDMDPYVYVENDMPTAVPDSIHKGVGGFAFSRPGPISPDFEIEDVTPNLVRRACQYIVDRSKESDPFFLYLPLPSPHTPIVPTKEFQGKSGLNPYADFVLMVDAMVGQIMQTLDDKGIADNTLIVFTSDNGCSPTAVFKELHEKGHYPNYIYRGHKADLFDGGHRVPCILRWPDGAKPHQVDQTICLTDFMATFSALAGYELRDNEGEDSYNILPLILSDEEQEPIREATVHHSIDGDFTIRKGEWKLLLSPGSGGWSAPNTAKAIKDSLPMYQLYNMTIDPGESKNLYAEHPEIVKELKNLMTKYVKDGRSTPGEPQKNDGEYPWKQLKWMEN